MPALVNITGFEYGITPSVSGGGLCNSVWGTAGTTYAIESTIKRTGGYSLKAAPTASVRGCVGWTVPSTAIGVARFYIYIGVEPSSNADVCHFAPAAGSYLALTIDPSDHKFKIADVTSLGTILGTGPVYSTGVWYQVDLKWDYSANPSILYIKIDGGAEFSGSMAQAASTTTSFRLGNANTTGPAYTCYYDDLSVSVTSIDYPIGAGAVVGLSPNAGGTSNPNPPTNIQDNASVTVNDSTNPANIELDDVPFGTTTDYIQQVGTQTGYAGVGFADTAQTTIHGVMALEAYHSAAASPGNSASARMWDGTTETAIYTGDMTESSLFYKSKILPIPSGGWTMALVNSLQGRVGFATDYAPVPYWDTLMIEVAYGTVAGITGTLTKTLDGISLSATGVVSVGGSLTKTLDGITKTITGTVDVIGTVSKTLDGIAANLAGAVDVKGNLTKTLDGIILQATGTVGAAEITGTLNITLDAITFSASGGVAVSGNLTKTLDGVGLSTSGTVAVVGSLDKTLDGIGLSTSGVVSVAGTLSKTLDGIGLSAAGVVIVSGILNAELAGISLDANGTVGTTPIIGNLDKTLDGINISAIGVVAIAGALTKTLDGISLSTAGVVSISGISNITLDGIGISTTGIVSISGGFAKTLDNITLSGIGAVSVSGIFDKTLAGISFASVGAIEVKGMLDKSLDAITLSASGTVSDPSGIKGTLDIVLGGISLASAGVVSVTGSANISLSDITLYAIGATMFPGKVAGKVIAIDRVFGSVQAPYSVIGNIQQIDKAKGGITIP